MANTTAITANFQARDWEFLFGINGYTQDVDTLDCKDKLRKYYSDQVTKPSGNTVINISTFEGVVVALYQKMLGSSAGVALTDNGQPYGRIRAAVLAMNNAADGYILNTVGTVEAAYQAVNIDLRKKGRKDLMLRGYDAN